MANQNESDVSVVTAVAPLASVAATVTPPIAVDRMPVESQSGWRSGVLRVSTGAIAGSPTVAGIVLKVQDSDDGITFSDYTDPVTGAVPTLTFSEGSSPTAFATPTQSIKVNLAGAKRYVGVHRVTTFTGGSTPSVVTGAVFALDDASLRD